MEGRVYNCGWTEENGRYRVWVQSNPSLSADGASLSEADESLWGKICERLGDGENLREYDPPLPRASDVGTYFVDELVRLVGNTSTNIEGSLHHFFAEGVCPACGSGRGERTGVPLEVGLIESGYDAAFTSLGLTHFSLYSEGFLKLLGGSEAAEFEWRMVRRGRRARKVFFELTSRHSRPWMAKRGWELSGWQCEECGQMAFGHWGRDFAFRRAIASNSVPPSDFMAFVVGSRTDMTVCVRRSKWREMRGKIGAKGIVAEDVAVLPIEELDDHPELPKRNPTKEGYSPSR